MCSRTRLAGFAQITLDADDLFASIANSLPDTVRMSSDTGDLLACIRERSHHSHVL
jgi:hypothetical protein